MKRRRKGRALRRRYGHAMPLDVLEKRAQALVNLVKSRGGHVK